MTTRFGDRFSDVGVPMLNAQFGEAVTLQRSTTSTAIAAARGRDREYEIADAEGVLTTIIARDYLIAVADYTISGSAVTPRQGDVIVDSDSRQWQVQPLAGKPDHERHGLSWLIRTRCVA